MKTYYLFVFLLCMYCNNISGQLACYSNVNAAISIDGTLDLRPIDLLYTPMNPARTYALSRSNFNYTDVGNTYLITIYEYEGGVLINSCFSSVLIENKFDGPLPCGVIRAWCSDLTLPLNASGDLSVTPELLARGPVNPAFNYAVSPTHFDCADLGTNVVTLTVTSSNGATSTCTANITVTNPSLFFSPCFRLFARYFRFFPQPIFVNSVSRGTIVPFELEIAKDDEIKKHISGNLTMVLSKDQTIGKEDAVLFSKKVQLKNKDAAIQVNSKFTIPVSISPGDYFILMDIYGDSDKQSIGFEKYVQKVTINNLLNDNPNPGLRTKAESDNLLVFPNPFGDAIVIKETTKEILKIEIKDILGRIWIDQEVNSNLVEINTSHFPAGAYFAKITKEGDEIQVLKLLKTN
jgi:hypothetical protein